MSVTIKDVAKAAGVSVATVSRVLNGSPNVSEAATDIVNKTIQDLNYSPNFLGRNLRKCETHVILAITPSSDQSLYSQIIYGMQLAASICGYDIITMISSASSEIESRQMNMLFNRTVDGAVLLGTQYDANTLNAIAEKYCIALCCEAVDGADVLTVVVDDEQAAYDATKALISKAHRKIAFIGTKQGDAKSSIERESGYLRALREHNIPIRDDYIYRDTYDYQNGAYAVEKFLNLEDPPTAIFAISDLIAAGAIKKLVSLGINVGSDFPVIGFDNIQMSEMFCPSISTAAQPCAKMGQIVVEKLIDNMNSSIKDNKLYYIPHEIILRESTGDCNFAFPCSH